MLLLYMTQSKEWAAMGNKIRTESGAHEEE